MKHRHKKQGYTASEFCLVDHIFKARHISSPSKEYVPTLILILM